MGWFSYTVILTLVFVDGLLAQLEETSPLVQTAKGKIKGRLEHTADGGKGYYVFQGIPYAQPPVNELRFRAPVPVQNWDGVLETTADEKKCMQHSDQGSEDCLYVNVFTPTHKSTKLPVMVWIYGGYYFKGDSKEAHFGPEYLVEENVVVVTFNYRLGVFGFLSTEDDVSPGNYALKDQILALRWVQENIPHFGGDPERVTLFGESAGAASVSYLLQAPQTKGLFSKAIMESGVTLCPWSISRHPRKTANMIAATLDVDYENSTHLVEALRRVDAKTLQQISESTDLVLSVMENPIDTIIFGPSIEPHSNEAVVTKKSHEMLKRGELHKMPLMVGFNSEEGIFLSSVAELIRPFLGSFDIFRTSLVPLDMNTKGRLNKMVAAFSINRKYFGILQSSLTDYHIIRFITDSMFLKPIHEYVNIVSKFNPTYMYRFSYEGVLGVNGSQRVYKGVGHAEEISYLWNQKLYTAEPAPDDLLTRQRLVKLWTNFAKFGNPTPEVSDLFDNVIWSLSGHKNITYLDINKRISLSQNFDFYNIPYWKNLYRKYGNPPYDTY